MGGALIETRPVGQTGLQLSRIGYGSAPIGDLRRAPSDAETRALLQHVWDAGIRYFDTAPLYGGGLAERRVGDFLRDKPRDDYMLSSKVGRLLVPDRAFAMEKTGDPRALPFRPAFDYSYDGIMRSFEQSLQRLGLERVDILFVHDIGQLSHPDDHDESLKAFLDGGLRAMEELRQSGAVRAIGAGVNETPILEELMNHAHWDIFLLANRYTLLDHTALDSFLPRCLREGVMLIDGAPLNGGILATGAVPGAHFNYRPPSAAIVDRVNAIEAICRRHDVPMVRAGLAFPLGHPAIASIIPGPARPDEFDANLAHFRSAVPQALWDDLRAAGLLHKDAPVPVTPVLG